MAESLNYHASTSAVYYTAPKSICLGRFLLASAGAIVGIVVGAFAYGQFQPGLESISTRAGAMVVAAVATGLLAMMPVRVGRVQSQMLAALVGAILSLLSLHVMWVAWTHAIWSRIGYQLVWGRWVVRPNILFGLIRILNQRGVWVFNGHVPKSVELLFYWIGEGAAVVGCGVVFSIKSAGQGALICRECGAKCQSAPSLPRFAVDRKEELVASIEARDFSAMLEHEAPKNEDDPELVLRMLSCPRCKQMHVLSLSRVAWVVGRDNRPTVKATPLVNRLLITSDEAAIVRDLAAQIKQMRENQAGDGSGV